MIQGLREAQDSEFQQGSFLGSHVPGSRTQFLLGGSGGLISKPPGLKRQLQGVGFRV